jgi:hypothetical protein
MGGVDPPVHPPGPFPPDDPSSGQILTKGPFFMKSFNTAGPCFPEQHYMLPARARCGDLSGLIGRGEYFVIHAPRQTGKTTLLNEWVHELQREGRFRAIYCSLEAIQGIWEAEKGIPAIVDQLDWARGNGILVKGPIPVQVDRSRYTVLLKAFLAGLCASLDKPLVILFDEVDCLSNGTLIAFLRQIRDGYVNRDRNPFVHSIGLIGMRKIRDYRARVRDDRESLGSASPFNIVRETLTLRNFSREEVAALYAQHTAATGQVFGEEVVEAVFEKTGGQPWLVNAIAHEIVMKILEGDRARKVEYAHVEEAAQRIILRRDTHIDSLLERLKEERVRKVIFPVIAGKDGQVERLSDDFE